MNEAVKTDRRSSLAAEQLRLCGLCEASAGPSKGELGLLVGPFAVDKNTHQGKEFFVHKSCALWSPEVFLDESNNFRKVGKAYKRGRSTSCCHCKKRGATLGCRVERCRQSYHLPCAQQASVTFYEASYLIACPKHAACFRQEQTPQHQKKDRPSKHWSTPVRQLSLGDAALPCDGPTAVLRAPAIPPAHGRPHHGKRAAALDPEDYVRDALRSHKRYKAEARAAARMPHDDESSFRRKEARRLARDTAQLNPTILGGAGHAEGDSAVGQGWESVGGLSAVVKQLKEMVILPLLYPHIFTIQPPRGILFHGPPGCGKTLAVRALAGACASVSLTPVALFARRGADCLGKWSGDAERTLRLLFDEAAKRAPAIIFLDELDGLVPARAQRAGGQDQVFASVVSTLLALMDGLHDRGSVIVIAATNRPDSIDLALRRPGRFDREVYFALPDAADRAAILKVHTCKWGCAPSQQELHLLAQATSGWAGADLQSLCTSAVLAAARRCCPAAWELACRPPLPGQPHSSGAQQPLDAGHVQVAMQDWQAAMANSPVPCSLRGGMATLTPVAQPPLAHHLAPLLLPAVAAALLALQRQGWRLSAELADALLAGGALTLPASSGPRSGCEAWQALEHQLTLAGAIAPLEPLAGQPVASTSVQHAATDVGPRACRAVPATASVLVAGQGSCGQGDAAAAVLRSAGPEQCVCTLALPELLLAAKGGSLTAGCTAILQEALRRKGKEQLVCLFLPHVHTWAVEEAAKPDTSADADGRPEQQAVKRTSLHDGRSTERLGPRTLPENQQVQPAMSEAFAGFKQLLQQAHGRPILVVATSSRPAHRLPTAVQDFFAPRASAAGQMQSCQSLHGVVEVQPPSREAQQEAVHRSAHFLAQGIAQAGLAQLEKSIAQRLQAAASMLLGQPAPDADSTVQLHPTSMPASAPAPISNPAQPKQPVSSSLNEADAQAAQRLCSQVDLAVRACGAWLCQQKRAAAALPPPRRRREDWEPAPPLPAASLASAGTRAAGGQFGGDMAAFMAAVRAGTDLVKHAALPAGQRGRMRHLTALAAACSLSDDMAAWADSMRWRFGLWDPSVQRLMSHALAGQAARQPRPLAELQRELPCRRGSGGPSTPGGTRKFEETDSDDSSDNEAHRFYLGETGPSQVMHTPHDPLSAQISGAWSLQQAEPSETNISFDLPPGQTHSEHPATSAQHPTAIPSELPVERQQQPWSFTADQARSVQSQLLSGMEEPARQLLEQHFLKIAMPSPGALKETMQSTSRAAVPPLMQLILTLIEEVTVDLQGLQADCTYADYVGIYSQAVMTRVLANARLQQHWHGIAVSMH